MNLITEGAITFETESAFYNPKMLLNRDIGVAMASCLGLSDYLDALSASGIRGLRVAKEAGVEKGDLKRRQSPGLSAHRKKPEEKWFGRHGNLLQCQRSPA